jgi:hypothetical protein
MGVRWHSTRTGMAFSGRMQRTRRVVTAKTEFGRVVDRLGITLINALTPQAKGRVERANQTLQDRLIKEMRLSNIIL